VDCDSSTTERMAVRRQLLAGEIRIVCNVDIIGMGVDWPEVSCVIYARPTKSEMRFVQNIGRVLRVAPGKEDAIILDHSDTHLRLGFVTDIEHAELNDGRRRESIDPGPRLPKECPAYGYLKPPRTAKCAHCGHEVEHHAKPVEVKKGKLEHVKLSSKEKFADRAVALNMFAGYALLHKYKPGFALAKYNELYGCFPPWGVKPTPIACSPELEKWIKSRFIRRALSPRAQHERDQA